MLPRPLLVWQLAHAKVEPGMDAPLGDAAFIGAPEGRIPVRYIFSPAASASLLGDAVAPVRAIRARRIPGKRRQETRQIAASFFFIGGIVMDLRLNGVKRVPELADAIKRVDQNLTAAPC
jgi:hypothetical protein